MLKVEQVSRVREIVAASEDVVHRLKVVLQVDGMGKVGFMDMRIGRIEKELQALSQAVAGMSRILQDVIVEQYLHAEGVKSAPAKKVG